MSDNLPNILWLMTDEQRCDSLGCYGSTWARTPHLDALAREGVVFRNAVTPAPVCVPARASLSTGLYPHQHGLWWNVNNKDRTLPHLTEAFHRVGYQSASFGKQHYCASNQAFDTEVHFEITDLVSYFQYAQQFDEQEFGAIAYPGSPYRWILGGRFPGSADDTTEARCVRLGKEWLESRNPNAPFLLQLSFNLPHTPVTPPEPFASSIVPDEILIPAATETASPRRPRWIDETLTRAASSEVLTRDQIRAMRAFYYGAASFVDSQIGDLLGWMRERHLLDDTIVVFVSDHGCHLGDFGLVQKQTFYDPVVNVPFLFWHASRIPGGRTVETPVETRNLLATLLELAGLPLPERIDGRTYTDALTKGGEPEAAPVFSEFSLGTFGVRKNDRLVMIRDGKWKMYVCYAPDAGDGALYNLESDPYERQNLFGVPAHAEQQTRLQTLIDGHLLA